MVACLNFYMKLLCKNTLPAARQPLDNTLFSYFAPRFNGERARDRAGRGWRRWEKKMVR
jgi:hypothetical protein